MDQRDGDVALLDRAMQVFCTAAANTVNKVCEVIASGFAGRPGLDLVCEESLVGVVAINHYVSVGTVKEITDGVGLGILRAERLLSLSTGMIDGGFETGGRDGASTPRGCTDLRFMVSNPVADFDFQHLALTICIDKAERS